MIHRTANLYVQADTNNGEEIIIDPFTIPLPDYLRINMTSVKLTQDEAERFDQFIVQRYSDPDVEELVLILNNLFDCLELREETLIYLPTLESVKRYKLEYKLR